jgi:hypothetical protein
VPVRLARDLLGVHPEGDIVTYHDDPLEDPGVLPRPAAVVVRGVRVLLDAVGQPGCGRILPVAGSVPEPVMNASSLVFQDWADDLD